MSWQNKIRTNLCCNFPQKTKFGLTCVGIFHTKQNCNLCCNFPHKTKCGSTSIGFFYTKRKKLGSSYIAIVLSEQNSDQPMLQFSTQNKIRINLCWTFPHKKNSDQPMLQFSIQTKFEKRALVCEDLFQPRLVSTFLIILGSQDRTPFSKSNNG